MKKIAHFGAFDHDSYGDLLFPRMLELLLPDFTLIHVSPTGLPSRWADACPTLSIAEAIRRTDWDGVIIGGGDIIQSGEWSTAKWRQHADMPAFHLAGLWAGAAFLSAKLNIPAAWNAPGVPKPIPGEFSDTVRLALACSDVVAVRDNPGRLHLEPFTDRPITVVPDTALVLGQLWPAEGKDDTIVLAVSRADARKHAPAINALIRQFGTPSDGTPRHVVVAPLMAWEFPDGTPSEWLDACSILPRKDDPGTRIEDTARLIGRSSGYVGNSLHGLVTALAYGVPAVLVQPDVGWAPHKYRGFIDSLGLDPASFIASTWAEAEGKLLRQRQPADIQSACLRIRAHAEAIRALMQAGPVDKTAIWRQIAGKAGREAESLCLQGVFPEQMRDVARDKASKHDRPSAQPPARARTSSPSRKPSRLDRFIHALHLQGPYHLACRLYRASVPKTPDGPALASPPASPVSGIALARQQHMVQAQRVLQDFLFAEEVLDFTLRGTPQVSIVIVVYNRAELTLACLRSLLPTPIPLQIIIVDNASTDLTPMLLSRIRGATIIRNSENLHFLRACNQGGHKADGTYILLLNNDTEVLPGAIPQAMACMERYPDAGAVGGRLILPDGRLQEAGGIIWRDGMCSGYGRSADPEDGAYLFSRPVDYCSGAFLLTPTTIWKKLGGFDNRYSPAYYEETDYCLRLRKAGLQVYYEPRACIRHYEFGSAPSTESAAQLMRKNRETFAAAHADLTSNRPRLGSVSDILLRSPPEMPRLRVLIFDERLPILKSGAGYPRANQMMRTLLELGYDVTLYPIVVMERVKRRYALYEDIPPEVEVLGTRHYGINNIDAFLNTRKGFYSLVIVSRPSIMRLLRPLFKANPHWLANLPLIYDAEAIFALREFRMKTAQGLVVTDEERQTAIEEEIALCDNARAVLAVSREEVKLFQDRGLPAFVVGHAVTAEPATPEWDARADFLFLGAIMDDSGPNFETVTGFLEHVWPELSRRLPDARFIIAGTNTSHRLTHEPLPDRVVVTGALDTLEPVYNAARVFVAPTRASAGIPLKVIEAAAHGVPVVCSSLLARQLQWEDGRELTVADDGPAFVDACVALYNDPGRWQAQRDAARMAVEAQYSHKAFKAQLLQAIASSCGESSRMAPAGRQI